MNNKRQLNVKVYGDVYEFFKMGKTPAHSAAMVLNSFPRCYSLTIDSILELFTEEELKKISDSMVRALDGRELTGIHIGLGASDDPKLIHKLQNLSRFDLMCLEFWGMLSVVERQEK